MLKFRGARARKLIELIKKYFDSFKKKKRESYIDYISRELNL